ncbi:sporulation protein [Bacillus lacus]|uniref:Sporulation protein n=1 Tax=Metabacillus lacus TaxID=1983721 RepID=A0A7X2LZU7_9BACI|nr:sporulation protein [Metabacillus lacus]
MLKKCLSLMKVGIPHVNLVLECESISAGSKVCGAFHVKGGWIKQHIKRLECDLVREVPEKSTEFVDAVTTILMSRTIEVNDESQIPFTYHVPDQLAPSSENVSYRFQTRLVFKDDMICNDHDEILITSA